MVIFHSYVSLPEGTRGYMCWKARPHISCPTYRNTIKGVVGRTPMVYYPLPPGNRAQKTTCETYMIYEPHQKYSHHSSTTHNLLPIDTHYTYVDIHICTHTHTNTSVSHIWTVCQEHVHLTIYKPYINHISSAFNQIIPPSFLRYAAHISPRPLFMWLRELCDEPGGLRAWNQSLVQHGSWGPWFFMGTDGRNMMDYWLSSKFPVV